MRVASGLKRALMGSAALLLGAISGSASGQVGPYATTGHINDVTFAGEYVMIRIDAGVSGNCEGTPWGWMRIPVQSKSMSAFVIGLWMRGDAATTVVSVYTDGLMDGYCRITQIDPVG
jgi:hypothetical protein